MEVGGIRGREALDRLRNVVGRVESSWRPATAEEGFEIVRRRPTTRLRRAVPEPLAGPEAFKQRDVTARAFADLYRAQVAEFPPGGAHDLPGLGADGRLAVLAAEDSYCKAIAASCVLLLG